MGDKGGAGYQNRTGILWLEARDNNLYTKPAILVKLLDDRVNYPCRRCLP